jgi:hypothetical protein
MSAGAHHPIVRVRHVPLESIVGETRLYPTTYSLATLAGAPGSIARVPEAAWLAASSGCMLIAHTVLAGGLAFAVLVLAGANSWATLPAMVGATGWAALTAAAARRSLRRTLTSQGGTWSTAGLFIGHALRAVLASTPGLVALAVVLTQVGLGGRATTETDLVLLVATVLVPISGMLSWAPASDAVALAARSPHRPPSAALRVLIHSEGRTASPHRAVLHPAARAMVWVGGLRDDVANRWVGVAALAVPRGALILSSGILTGTACVAWSWGAAPSVVIGGHSLLLAASQALTLRHLLIWVESDPGPRSLPKATAAAGTALLLVVMCAAQASSGFLGPLDTGHDPGGDLSVSNRGGTATIAIAAITAVVGCVTLLPFATLPTHRARWRAAAGLIRLHDQAARNRSKPSV